MDLLTTAILFLSGRKHGMVGKTWVQPVTSSLLWSSPLCDLFLRIWNGGHQNRVHRASTNDSEVDQTPQKSLVNNHSGTWYNEDMATKWRPCEHIAHWPLTHWSLAISGFLLILHWLVHNRSPGLLSTSVEDPSSPSLSGVYHLGYWSLSWCIYKLVRLTSWRMACSSQPLHLTFFCLCWVPLWDA